MAFITWRVCVCVCVLQRLCVTSHLCQFHLHLKTLFGPRTVQEICPVFLVLLVLSWSKNSIKRDLNACLHSLLYECLCAYMCVSGFMTVDWIRAKQNYFLLLVEGRLHLTGASLHVFLLHSISTICVYKHGQILYALNPLAIIH